MKQFAFCPWCANKLFEKQHEEQVLLACECGFIHYDNPVPVVACIVPFEGGIVCVQRKNPPFPGQWCLPCGYMNRHGHPKNEACREVFEETGLKVAIEKILCACNPAAGEINQITISYLARVIGGSLKAGDDASAVDVFQKGNPPNLCFRSHNMLLNNWCNGVYGEITGKDLEW